jgi:hypothetical protein
MPSSLNAIHETLRSLDHCITADCLANLLELNLRTIYLKPRTGRMPCVRLHGVVRFDPIVLADWLDSATLPTTKRPLKDSPKVVAL